MLSLPTAPALQLDFEGWDRPLRAHGPAGEGVLAPWTLGRHLPVLGAVARVGDEALELDEALLIDAVLEACWRGPDLEGLDELALWWAASPGAALPDREGWLELGQGRVQLRPWTFRERALALARATDEHGLNVVEYMTLQLDDCVGRGGLVSWRDLPAGPVLAALVALHRAPILPAGVGAQVLRAARALGCLPGVILAAPAAEIDLLLGLLDGEEAPAPRPLPRGAAPPLSALASQPDAEVILFAEGDA